MALTLLENICKKYDIMLLYLFGSQQATGMRLLQGEKVTVTDPLTDIDVGVVFRNELPPPYPRVKLYADLYNDLVDFFVPFHLDLTLLQENHSVFQLEAVARGTCVYSADEDWREHYEMNIMRRAADFQWVLDKFYEEKLADY